MVQWLGLHAFTAGAWLPSLVGELRSLKLWCTAKKKKQDDIYQESNTVADVTEMVRTTIIHVGRLEFFKSA